MTDLRDLLKRIRQWDALDIPNTDGAYWKREIDAALEQPEREPFAWLESPYGSIRMNTAMRFQFPPQSLKWKIPLYTHLPRRETEQEPVASAGLGPLPEPAQPAEPEGYMPGCLWPLPATPDYYTAEQMREYALRALVEQVQEPVAWRWGYRSVTTGEMDWRGYVEIPAHPNLRSPEIIMEPLYAAPPQRPVEPAGCDHCNHPLYAAVKCKVCGRAT